MADTTISSITPIEYGRTVIGNKRLVIADLVMDGGDWPSGGIALTPANFGLQGIDALVPMGSSKVSYKWGSNVLQAYISTTAGAAMAVCPAVAISETVRVMVIGWGLAP